MNEVFPDKFLAAIGVVSLRIKRTAPRIALGSYLAARPGSSHEFRDFQEYSPGDDLRRVDWSVYGRTRHLFVRRYERQTSVSVYVIVDSSRSMHLNDPPRYPSAARIAAAVVAAAAEGQNPVRLISTAEGAIEQSCAGRQGLVRILGHLAEHQKPSRFGIARAIEAALTGIASRRARLVVIVSDFFEPSGLEPLLVALRKVPGGLVLVRITRPDDARPQVHGDFQLKDCETGAELTISADAAARVRYHDRYRRYFDALEAYATERGARHVDIDVNADPVSQLEPLFPAGVLSL